jgi:P pilus assembly protein, chaperone PapD
MMRAFFHQAACGLVFLLVAATAWAGSFQVTPVQARLSASQPVVALTVRNTGANPAVIQLQAMAWSQQAGKDVYAPAPDMLATPPIFSLPVGATQVIRVGSRQPPDAGGERAYRLFLREVPPAPKPGFQGLRMALQIALPVFVVSATTIAPNLHWQAAPATAGRLRISVVNRGSAHARLARFNLFHTGDARALPMPPQTVYVLAGATHEWLIEPGSAVATGTPLHLTAQTDTGTLQADLVVSDP